jgi:hypothetical protein
MRYYVLGRTCFGDRVYLFTHDDYSVCEREAKKFKAAGCLETVYISTSSLLCPRHTRERAFTRNHIIDISRHRQSICDCVDNACDDDDYDYDE